MADRPHLQSRKRERVTRVRPIRWNPLEGSSNGPAQVSVRGNTDFQSMLRTFPDGFHGEGHQEKNEKRQDEDGFARIPLY